MKIAFIALSGPASWNDTNLATGLGGSEAMVTLYAREFAKSHEVTCFTNNSQPGTYNGVEWRDASEIGGHYDVAVSLRTPAPLARVSATVRALFANDQGCPALPSAVFNGVCNQIITISQHQTARYKGLYPSIPPTLFFPSSAGVEWNAYGEELPRNPAQCMYTSTLERGMMHFERLWPRILEQVPQANLVITSGFQLYGMSNDEAKRQYGVYFDRITNLPHVEYVGPVPRKELQRLQLASGVWLYPTDYEEQCCISALEAMSAREALVTTALAALPERVTNGVNGYLVEGKPGTTEYDDAFVGRAVEVISNGTVQRKMGTAGRELAADHDYGVLTKAWVSHFEGML